MDEMKKYIIELPESTHWIQWIMESTKDHHPYMDYKQVEDLTPFTEPNLDAIRKEAYEKGLFDGKNQDAKDFADMYDSGYSEGLKDAWEAARKIRDMTWKEQIEAFGTDSYADIIALSAFECIEKIRQYEQEKEEQIIKGDIVLIKSTPEVEILVTYADKEYVSGIALTEVDGNCEIGDQYTDIRISNVEKTGKHYDIVSVLRKMRENNG